MAIPTIDEQDINPYSRTVMASKNVIFRGAPGTGKTYLARSIAANMVSGGRVDRYDQLTGEEKSRVGFVQFHPSYDYTDFVEGLRPKVNADGSMGFELRDGVFKAFVDRARGECEAADSAASVEEAVDALFADEEAVKQVIRTCDKYIHVKVEDGKLIHLWDYETPPVWLGANDLRKLLSSKEELHSYEDVKRLLRRPGCPEPDGVIYYLALYHAIRRTPHTYVFIIDEINRGEISKIFGELFFSVDPGYRGRAGEVSTQYANLHTNPSEKFYIPENVYIIGTMNDIDRSVDTFDFAMRRRFRFVELRAEDCTAMLDALGDKREDAERRMTALNREILQVEELNENYQIGPAYFLKLDTLTPDQLWTDYLQPLLRDYIQGMYDEAGIMERLERAYFLGEAR